MVTAGGEPAPELGRRGGLARALEAGHQHDRGQARGGLDARRGLAAEERHHLVADDADHGLRGGEALQDVLARRARAHALEELLHDPEVDVGFEQREADVAERRVHLALVEGAVAAEGPEHALELFAERVEQGNTTSAREQSPSSRRRGRSLWHARAGEARSNV
jgi:hypothetical protein